MMESKEVFAQRKAFLRELGLTCPDNEVTRVLAMIIGDSDLSLDEKKVLGVARGLKTGVRIELPSAIVVALYPYELGVREVEKCLEQALAKLLDTVDKMREEASACP